MKKKVAIIANGWYNKGIYQLYGGMKKYAEVRSIDLFLFLSFSQFRETDEYNKGEFNIHRLPDYNDFDGVIFIPGSLSSNEEVERIRKELIDNNIPAVTIGERLEGLGFVSCENYESMLLLCEEIIKQREINSVAFIAGHRENEESNQRLAAARTVFGKNGVKIEESDVYYCNWEYSSVCMVTSKLARKRKNMPDAIICANDYGAMAVCSVLKEEGYDVPEDVIVTGFDNIDLSRAFSPSITTLSQPYDAMGYGSIELLYEQIESGEVSERHFSCDFIRGESTGFEDAENADNARKELAKQNFIAGENNILFEWTNTNIENSFYKAKSFEELSPVLNQHFMKFNEYEGNNFAIVLEHKYRDNIYDIEADLKNVGYSEEMAVLVGIDGDETYTLGSFESKSIIPRYREESGSHLYIIASLHSKNNIFGYVVFKDAIDKVLDRSLCSYMTRLGELFEKYRKTMRLDKVNAELMDISVKDSLTGIFNRMGYDRVVIPYYNKLRRKGKCCGIVFIDINRMKYINDTYGHLQGDMAIRTVAAVIMECIPSDWMAVRYGGDEYILIGVCEDESALQYISERVASTITKRGDELKLPYRLTASAGYMMTDSSTKKSLEEYVIAADEYMYKNKKRTYEEEKNIAERD